MLKTIIKGGFYMDYYSILKNLGIDINEIKKYEVLSENGETIFWIELLANQRKCPTCSNDSKIKDYKTRVIKANSVLGNQTYIEMKVPRYICKVCHKSYMHCFNIANKSIHKPMILDIIEDFSKTITFSDIAEKYNISTTKTIEIFDEYCPNLRANIGEIICIDEFSNIRKSDDKYACMLVDFKEHTIIDIIKNRTLRI